MDLRDCFFGERLIKMRDLSDYFFVVKGIEILIYMIGVFIPFVYLLTSDVKKCDNNCIEALCSVELLGGECVCFNSNYTAYCSEALNDDKNNLAGLYEYKAFGIVSIIGFLTLAALELTLLYFRDIKTLDEFDWSDIYDSNVEIQNKFKKCNEKRLETFYIFQLLTNLLYFLVIIFCYIYIDFSKFKHENTCPYGCIFDDDNLCACYNENSNTFTFIEQDEELTHIYKSYVKLSIIVITHALIQLFISIFIVVGKFFIY